MCGPPQSMAEIDSMVDLIYEAFEGASQATLDSKGSCPAHAARWWSGECTDTVKQVQEDEEEVDISLAKANLKRTIQAPREHERTTISPRPMSGRWQRGDMGGVS